MGSLRFMESSPGFAALLTGHEAVGKLLPASHRQTLTDTNCRQAAGSTLGFLGSGWKTAHPMTRRWRPGSSVKNSGLLAGSFRRSAVSLAGQRTARCASLQPISSRAGAGGRTAPGHQCKENPALVSNSTTRFRRSWNSTVSSHCFVHISGSAVSASSTRTW